MDQRDKAIDQLSQLMDIRVSTDSNNQTTVYTTNGVELVGVQASTLNFNSQGTLNANSQWNSNPANSTVGTITIKLANGANIDMIATNSISSGQIAADLTLRDKTLVQAQAQIDQLAASMASALSDKTTAGTAAPAALAPKAGFDLDLSNVLPGNTINLTYTDSATNTQHQVSIVRVDDPAALPLSNAGANPNNPVIGVNFFGGMASVVSQLNSALGSANLQFSNPVRLDVARARQRHRYGDRQRGLGDRQRLRRWRTVTLSSRCLPTEIRCIRVRSRGTARNRPDWRDA